MHERSQRILLSSAGWLLGPLLWIWWQGRLRFVPPHLHERVILIVHGRAECGISLGMDESTAWGFEQGEVQVGMGSEWRRIYAEISHRRETCNATLPTVVGDMKRGMRAFGW